MNLGLVGLSEDVVAMSEYPLTIDGIRDWFVSKDETLRRARVKLAAVFEGESSAPFVYADLDSAKAIGRIYVWATGEVNFEVIDLADGKDLLFRRVHATRLEGPELDAAFGEFVRCMAG